LSYLANTQTDRQTDKVWQKHYLLGGGNYCNVYCCYSYPLAEFSTCKHLTKTIAVEKCGS